MKRRPPKPRRQTTAYRWSRVIQHRPWTSALAGAVILLLLAIPVLGLRLGNSDESNYPDDTSTKQAYDLLVAGFGPGFNGPLLLAAELPEGTDVDSLDAVTEAVAADPDVALASPPQLNEDGTAVIWQVIPNSGPQEKETTQLVERLRDDVLPPVEDEIGTQVSVTGNVAVGIDFTDYLASRTPYFFAAVLGLSFLLLMVVFRSLLVPLKAVIMNMLSIAAAYGIVVALFQWGWLSDITGVEPAPIEPWIPMMLFAIVFGLSMDYEVFLLSRIREEWIRTGDSRTAVADGLAVDGQGHHRGGRHHGVRLRQLHPRGRPGAQADGHRPGGGDPARRHHRPHAARARHDGAAGRQELVAPPLARPHPAQPRRRGARRTAARGRGRGARPGRPRARADGRPVRLTTSSGVSHRAMARCETPDARPTGGSRPGSCRSARWRRPGRGPTAA